MAITADDQRHMARALRLARRGMYTTDPNPNVGCVLVNAAGEVVGEGFHQQAGQPHAEPLAIRAAGDRARGTTAYVTLEPCNHHGRTPPCADALITAGVTRVVAATEDPNPTVSGRGYAKLRAAGIEVEAGVLEAEAIDLNRGYTQRMQHGRPWVRAKLAVSVDGRTALANGQSHWITGDAARADVHHWRARSSAILSGIGTVLADNPRLNARVDTPVVQPLRVIADSHLRTPADARLLSEPADAVLLAFVDDRDSRRAELERAGAGFLQLHADAAGGVALGELLSRLGEQGINEVLVEAGPRLNGALLDAGLIDEIIVYQAPCLMGATAQGMFAAAPLSDLSQRYNLRLQDMRRFGDDVRMIYEVVRPCSPA